MRTRQPVGVHVVALVTTGAAIVVPVLAAPAANAAPAPLITVAVSAKSGAGTGRLTQPNGPVRIAVRAVGDTRSIALFSIRRGHMLAQVKAQEAKFSDDADFHAEDAVVLRRFAKMVDLRGGATADKGTTATMTAVLKPGIYYIADDGTSGFRLRKLTVTSTKDTGVAPRATASVTMTEKRAFGGTTTLPAKGTIRVTNSATSADRVYGPAFLRVRTGTTTTKLRQAFAGTAPNPFVAGVFGANFLSPGRSQLLTYDVAAGPWAMMCIAPSADGVPHGFRTMNRVVTMK